MQGEKTVILLNVAYTPIYDSNLILLSQLCKSKILYHIHPDSIILRKKVVLLK